MPSPSQKKKTVGEQFSEFIDFVVEYGRTGAARQHTRPEAIEDYEKIGREAREKRQTMRATPKPVEEKDVLGELVFKKVPAQQERMLKEPMTKKALEEALDLAEQMERAKSSKDLDLRKWVEAV